MFEANFRVYGGSARSGGNCSARASMWPAARYARLMRAMGLEGIIREQATIRTTVSDKAASPCPLDHVNRQFHAPGVAEHAMGLRLHLRRDLDRLRLCRLCHRHLCPPDRRLAGEPDGACQLRPGRSGTGSP